MQDTDSASAVTVPASGGVSAEPLAYYDPGSSLWKTSQGSLLEGLGQFSGPWPASGLMRNGQLYERPMSVLPTAAPESLSWPTPNTGEGRRGADVTANRQGSPTLTGVVCWLTPQSRDHKGISQKVAKGLFTGGLPDQLLGLGRRDPENHNTPGNPRGSSLVLNARWVLCLMGFPTTWLDGVAPPSRRQATRLSPRLPSASPPASLSS